MNSSMGLVQRPGGLARDALGWYPLDVTEQEVLRRARRLQLSERRKLMGCTHAVRERGVPRATSPTPARASAPRPVPASLSPARAMRTTVTASARTAPGRRSSPRVGCCIYHPEIAIDQQGKVLGAWYSNQTNEHGLFARALRAAGPTGPIAYVPGSSEGNRASSINGNDRTALIARKGGGSISPISTAIRAPSGSSCGGSVGALRCRSP